MESWSEQAGSEMEDDGEENIQDNSWSSRLSDSPPLSRNWSRTSNSNASVTSSIRLPPIHARPGTVWTEDGAAASAISLPRRLSAPEVDIRCRGQRLRGPSQTMAEQIKTDRELFPEKGSVDDQQVRFNHKGMDFLAPNLDDETFHDSDVDEAVSRRTEMYCHRGRRFSLPLADSPRNRSQQSSLGVFPKKHDGGCDLRQSRASTEKSRSRLSVAESDESQTFASRLEYYERLGRRYSLPQSSLLDGRMKLLNESVQEGEPQSESQVNTSPVGEEFQSYSESLTDLTGLTGGKDEATRRAQRYVHRGRRFSLPPPNTDAHSVNNATNKCAQGVDTSFRAKPNKRPATPIAAGSLNWKHVGWHSGGILSKSTECIANIQPVPPTDTLQTASKDVPVSAREDNQIATEKPKTDARRVKRGTRAPSGATWETTATHKTFSFMYNDESNKSELVSPPLVGGVVLKTVRADHPATESVNTAPEQPFPSVHPNTGNNNNVTARVHTSSVLQPVPPTVQILKDSWRRENEREKTIRVLQWILNEQAQRSSTDFDGSNLY